jgi:hypothetical protein
MSRVDKKTARQLAATREVMDKYHLALQALATEPDEKFKRAMEIARDRMKKYETVYRELSKR